MSATSLPSHAPEPQPQQAEHANPAATLVAKTGKLVRVRAVPSNAAKSAPTYLARDERSAAGKALRTTVPRSGHAAWTPSAKRRDPIDILMDSNRDRVPQLVPIRYGRMSRSPFTFLRGSAGLMAYDLSTTPKTGLRVQACGDCHLMNFGLYATPERNLVFDINDFDETLPAPWEWDLKRLAASFVVAGRAINLTNKLARAAAVECTRSYREHLNNYSKMSPLDIWYERIDAATFIAMESDAKLRTQREESVQQAKNRIADNLLPKIATLVGGRQRLIDQPPAFFHPTDKAAEERFNEALELYRLSLPDERRILFDHYHLEDFAIKAVGIGSVGTRCWVGLFFSADRHPLLLQFKEACTSVLEPYAGKSQYENHAQRVVIGQRLTQFASDIFLGWTKSNLGYDFFGRQLRDMKFSFPVEQASKAQFMHYATLCGWTLARAHATSGDAASIAGYLGRSDVFDEAIGDFALA